MGTRSRVRSVKVPRPRRAEGLEASVSETAGTYLCNESFYRVMAWSNEVGFDGRAGFLHVPMVPDSMSEEEAARIVAFVGEYALSSS